MTKFIVLKYVEMKTKLLLLVVFFFAIIPDVSSQKSGKKITVTGRVTGVYNSPVPGALIMIDGKNTSVKTNDEGFYKIKIKPTVKQIGVFTVLAGIKEEPVNDRTVIDFSLNVGFTSQKEKSEVSEEIVNAGYGSDKKGNISKPVTKRDVSGKEYSSFASIYDVLRTVPDVMVSGTSVTVRGVATMGSTSPLFVVNGVVVSSINAINPSMVKSIEVLKGPAASVYGLEGANGVILIQLK